MPQRRLRRERVTPLTPRDEQLVALLRKRPHTAQELAQVFGTRVPTIRMSVSRLAKKVPVVALFRYGQTRYALDEESSEEEKK